MTTTAALTAVDDFGAVVAIGDLIPMTNARGFPETYRLEGVEPEAVLVRRVNTWASHVRGPLQRVQPGDMGLHLGEARVPTGS